MTSERQIQRPRFTLGAMRTVMAQIGRRVASGDNVGALEQITLLTAQTDHEGQALFFASERAERTLQWLYDEAVTNGRTPEPCEIRSRIGSVLQQCERARMGILESEPA